jgi:hypothetical protein
MDHFDDDDRFNIDMIMPEPSYRRKEVEVQKKTIVAPHLNRLKFKKGKKLILKKNKEMSKKHLNVQNVLGRSEKRNPQMSQRCSIAIIHSAKSYFWIEIHIGSI